MGMERLAPDYPANKMPRLLQHPSWEAALRKAVRAIPSRPLTAVIGAPGVGKSLLLSTLSEAMKASGDPVTLVRHVGLRGWADGDILLLDEADKLSGDDLRLICARDKPVVLAGLPVLLETLRSLSLEPATVEIGSLRPEEIPAFVRGLLNRDGSAARDIDDAAIGRLAQRSAGVPRDTVILTDLASFVAEQEGAARILTRHVDEAIGLRYADADELAVAPEPPDHEPATLPSRPRARRHRRLLWLALPGLIAPAGLAGVVFWHFAEPLLVPAPPVATVAPVMPPPLAAVEPSDTAAADDPKDAVDVVPPTREIAAPAAQPPTPPVSSTADAAIDPVVAAQPKGAPPVVTPPSDVAEETPPATSVQALSLPATEPAFPQYASPHVVVNFPDRDADAGRAAQTVVTRLAALGLAVAAPRPSAGTLVPGVVYFFAQDAAGATALGQTLDLPVRQAPATPSAITPGTIDIALRPHPHEP